MAIVGGFGAELGSLLQDIPVRRQPGKQMEWASASETPASETLHYDGTSQESSHFSDFIRRMLEIRDTLRIAGCPDSIALPNIVVIGSQSSGKSSVLESIVGHEFLPKGQNMVTRRPLELTLINDPNESRERVTIHGYAQSVYDFAQVQQILYDLNDSVPEGEWISADPIKITIHSANVPDLMLVDLPGYIQVTNRSQPPVLRDKIRQLCDSYIRAENNIILAVSAADVDLANSEALKASRRFDPRGRRTIGVLTKLDLVDPEYAAQLIGNEDYPLQLGYVGVVCPPPVLQGEQSAQRSIKDLLHLSTKREDPRAARERAYFAQTAAAYVNVSDRVGIPALRRILTTSLERAITGSLDSVIKQVQGELNELRYQLKAQFSDRFVSPEAYLSELTSSIRQDFTRLGHQFTRAKIEASLREAFNIRLFQLCDDLFWQQESSSTAATNDPWRQLKNSLASLTRSGVGRYCTQLISESIRQEMQRIFSQIPLSYHVALKERLHRVAESTLEQKCMEATDQVENSLKPFKSGIEFTQADWRIARRKFLAVFEGEARRLAEEIETERKAIGSRKLKRAVEYLLNNNNNDIDTSSLDASPILRRAQAVVLKTAQLRRYSERLKALKGSGQHLDNLVSVEDYSYRRAWLTRITDFLWPGSLKPKPADCVYEANQDGLVTVFKDPRQVEAPEIYLFMVADRFLSACVPFLHHELVTEFLLPLPDQLVSAEHDGALSLARMSREELAQLIRENPDIADQLEMQERKRALDSALSKLTSMKSSSEK